MKLIFAGTPDIAAAVLQGLLASEHRVCAVLTQPDRPSGRGQKLIASPVKTLAFTKDIPVLQPLRLREADIQQSLKDFDADLMIVVAYGLIIPEVVLNIPKQGCWNVHVSLLPRWRGAAPIQRAIESGDTKTGVTLMQMDAGLDTGAILLQEEVAITPEMTGGGLHDLLAEMGRDILLQGLKLLEQGKLKSKPQSNMGVTYANKLNKEEARIDWSDSAIHLARKIWAFNPWPVCCTTYNDEMIRIWRARLSQRAFGKEGKHIGQIVYIGKEVLGVQTGEGILEILEVQRPAGKVLPMSTFLNGHRDFFKEGTLFI